VTYAPLTVFPNHCHISFLGEVVGRGLVVGPTLIVLVEGETALSKCLGRGFDSLAWQRSVLPPPPGRQWALRPSKCITPEFVVMIEKPVSL
jgi:hypothetical protein